MNETYYIVITDLDENYFNYSTTIIILFLTASVYTCHREENPDCTYQHDYSKPFPGKKIMYLYN